MRISSALGALFAECENTDEEVGGDDGALARLLVWLGEHFTEPIGLENAAQALGYSRNYLSHRIKEIKKYYSPPRYSSGDMPNSFLKQAEK